MNSPPRSGADQRRQHFEGLYEATSSVVLGYILRRTANPEDAADVLAETYLTAWRRLDDIPPGDEARLWLYGVARRQLANHSRGERRRSALAGRLRAELAAAAPLLQPDHAPAATAAAFHSMPAGDRELLALASWEGLDNGQIAAVLGCSRNAVRIRLHRARRRFAAALTSDQYRRLTPAHSAKGEHA